MSSTPRRLKDVGPGVPIKTFSWDVLECTADEPVDGRQIVPSLPRKAAGESSDDVCKPTAEMGCSSLSSEDDQRMIHSTQQK